MENELGENKNDLILKGIKILSILSETRDLKSLVQYVDDIKKSLHFLQKEKNNLSFRSLINLKERSLVRVEKTGRKVVVGFNTLPPHVICDEILPYIVFPNLTSCPFGNWGYFSGDVTRHLFCLSRNVTLQKNNFNPYVNSFQAEKVYYLKLDNFSMGWGKLNCLFEGGRMKGLTKLEIEDSNVTDKIFQHKSTIKEITMSRCKQAYGVNWDRSFFNSVETIDFEELGFSSNFFGNYFSKLKKLCIFSMEEISSNWNMMINLEVLKISNCSVEDSLFSKNLLFPKLKILCLIHCPKLSGNDWKEPIFLKELQIVSCYQIHDYIFEHFHFKRLEILQLRYLFLLQGDNWVSEFTNLKILSLEYCNDLNDKILQQKTFQNLEILVLRCRIMEGRFWNEFDKIRRVTFEGVDLQLCPVVYFNEKITQRVTDIKLKGIFCLVESSSKDPTIKKLELKYSPINDNFFTHENVVKNLTSLKLSQIKKIKGENWINIRELRSLKLDRLKNITDNLFKGDVFEKLESLEIILCDKLVGKGWRSMRNIKTFKQNGCYLFTDDFFQDNHISSIKDLEISNNDLILGKSWNELRVKRILIKNCENITDEIFQNFSFKLESLILVDNKSIVGHQWRVDNLRELKVLKIIDQRMSSKIFSIEFSKLRTLHLDNVIDFDWNFGCYKSDKRDKDIFKKLSLMKTLLLKKNLFPILKEISISDHEFKENFFTDIIFPQLKRLKVSTKTKFVVNDYVKWNFFKNLDEFEFNGTKVPLNSLLY